MSLRVAEKEETRPLSDKGTQYTVMQAVNMPCEAEIGWPKGKLYTKSATGRFASARRERALLIDLVRPSCGHSILSSAMLTDAARERVGGPARALV